MHRYHLVFEDGSDEKVEAESAVEAVRKRAGYPASPMPLAITDLTVLDAWIRSRKAHTTPLLDRRYGPAKCHIVRGSVA